ncbi:hypothetical protein EDEG_02602 [Edhazardia aedis USNM 41457]|uniref:t-SNARE coiled-coil homology domain-containing protein n=1 Tax=Edhazardia aedis (strain USNM 41457) TaxID=1003232 RepID=J9DK85_EDHAE|nr:hypothetical protein EDEG_02602 [Edhazardia aedis USNM 41457]|eukprot:EJW03020.1 hypothetical protein EDEG_02602 [Edhazardia aedis USNM 41457]
MKSDKNVKNIELQENKSTSKETQSHVLTLQSMVDDISFAESRKKKIEEVNKKTDEVIQLQNYIDCIVKVQGEIIDNIYYRMCKNEEEADKAITELRTCLNRKKKRKKFYWYFIYFFIILAVFLIIKAIF